MLLFLILLIGAVLGAEAVICSSDQSDNGLGVCVPTSVIDQFTFSTCSDYSSYGPNCDFRAKCPFTYERNGLVFYHDPSRLSNAGTDMTSYQECLDPAFTEAVSVVERSPFSMTGTWSFHCSTSSGPRFLGSGRYGDPHYVRTLTPRDVFRVPASVWGPNSLITGTRPYTIEAWYLFLRFQRTHVVSLGGPGAYAVLSVHDDSRIRILLPGPTTGSTEDVVFLSEPINLTERFEWFHLVVVQRIDDVAVFEVYLNGVGPYTALKSIKQIAAGTDLVMNEQFDFGVNAISEAGYGDVRIFNVALATGSVRHNYYVSSFRYRPTQTRPSWATAIDNGSCRSCKENERSSADGKSCLCVPGSYRVGENCVACVVPRGGGYATCDPVTGTSSCLPNFSLNGFGVCAPVSKALTPCADASVYPDATTGRCDHTVKCTAFPAETGLILSLDPSRATPEGLPYPHATTCSAGSVWKDLSANNLPVTVSGSPCFWANGPPRWDAGTGVATISASAFSLVAPLRDLPRSFDFWIEIDADAFLAKVATAQVYGSLFGSARKNAVFFNWEMNANGFDLISHVGDTDTAHIYFPATAFSKKWAHFTMVYSERDDGGTTYLSVYLDGTLYAQRTFTSLFFDEVVGFELNEDGIIDTWGEFRFYSRVLTATEVADSHRSSVHRYRDSFATQIALDSLMLNLDPAFATINGGAYSHGTQCQAGMVWKDISPSGLVATIDNAACVWALDPPRFESSGSVVTILNTQFAAVSPRRDQARTYDFWFDPRPYYGNPIPFIGYLFGISTLNAVLVDFPSDGSGFFIKSRIGGYLDSNVASSLFLPISTLKYGWIHISMAYDTYVSATGTLLKVYVDGQLRSSSTFLQRFLDDDLKFELNVGGLGIRWGEFRMYNRSLSALEILDSHVAAVGRYIPNSEVVGCPGCGLNQAATVDGKSCLCIPGTYLRNGICSVCKPGTYLVDGACVPCLSRDVQDFAAVCDLNLGTWQCQPTYTKNIHGVCVASGAATRQTTCADKSMYGVMCNFRSKCGQSYSPNGLRFYHDPSRLTAAYGPLSSTMACESSVPAFEQSLFHMEGAWTFACDNDMAPRFLGSGTHDDPYQVHPRKSIERFTLPASVWSTQQIGGIPGPFGITEYSIEAWNLIILNQKTRIVLLGDTASDHVLLSFDNTGEVHLLLTGLFDVRMAKSVFNLTTSEPQWVHVAVSVLVQANNEHRVWVYVNGNGPHAASHIAQSIAPNNPLILNSDFEVDDQYIRSGYGEVKVYNRALSEREIRDSYRASVIRYRYKERGALTPWGETTCAGCSGPNQVSQEDGLECMCVGGQYSLSSNCVDCNIGFWGPTCQTACVDRCGVSGCNRTTGLCNCPVGQFLETAVNNCVDCGSGTFTNKTNQNFCQPCAGGTFQPSTKTTSCLSCSAGKFSTAGSSTCQACANGTFALGGNAVCATCSPRLESNPYSYCEANDGLYYCIPPTRFRTSINRCDCLPNFFGTTCTACTGQLDPNTQCVDGFNGTGTYVCKTGLTLQSNGLCDCSLDQNYGPTCKPCGDKDVGLAYTHCDRGVNGTGNYICDSPLVLTNGMCECPTNSTGIGRSCNQTCSNCDTTTSTCVASSVEGAPPRCECNVNFERAMGMNSSDCNCQSGLFGLTCSSTCDPACTARTYGGCNDGYLGDGACNCGASRTLNLESNLCECPGPGQVGKYCLSCQPGTASVNKTATECTNCQPGTFSPSTQQETCRQCEAGTFSSFIKATSCPSCAPGQFSLTGSSTCTSCPAGSVSAVAKSGSCVTCSAGSVAKTAGLQTCTPCNPGSYSLSTSVCTLCAAGTAASSAGSSQCSSCQVGKYSTGLGNEQCFECADGFFSNTTGTVSCSPCPPNFSNNGGMGHASCVPVSTLPKTFLQLYSFYERTSTNLSLIELAQRRRFEFTATLALDFGLVRDDVFKGQFAYEISLVSNSTSQDVIISSVRAGSIVVVFNIPRQAALELQSQLSTSTVFTSTLLSAVTRMEVKDLSVLIQASSLISEFRPDCTETVPFPYRSNLCEAYGRCSLGACGCFPVDADGFCLNTTLSLGYTVPANVVCRRFPGTPDSCESQYTTANRIDYMVGDECRAKNPKYRNVFPLRRYCQHIDHTLGNDVHNAAAYFGRRPSLPCTNCTGEETIARLYTLYFPETPVANTTDGFLLRRYAYVSKLYGDERPVENKRWAWVEARYVHDFGIYQLSRLIFLPGTEGGAQWYYADGVWNYVGCAAGEYAIGPKECVCQLNHVRHPTTGLCVAGCNNGKTGIDCETELADANCNFNINSLTSFITQDCTKMVCKAGAFIEFNRCIQSNFIEPVEFITEIPRSSSSPVIDENTIAIVVVSTLAAIVFGLVVYYVIQGIRKRSVEAKGYAKTGTVE